MKGAGISPDALTYGQYIRAIAAVKCKISNENVVNSHAIFNGTPINPNGSSGNIGSFSTEKKNVSEQPSTGSIEPSNGSILCLDAFPHLEEIGLMW